MKVNIPCYRITSDWTYLENVEIDLDEYAFFQLELRLEERVWYLIGHWYDEQSSKWNQKELSLDGTHETDAAKFMATASKYRKCKDVVSRFNSLHHSKTFYNSLKRLIELYEIYSEDASADIGSR